MRRFFLNYERYKAVLPPSGGAFSHFARLAAHLHERAEQAARTGPGAASRRQAQEADTLWYAEGGSTQTRVAGRGEEHDE